MFIIVEHHLTMGWDSCDDAAMLKGLLLTLTLLNGGDSITTHVGIARGGIEVNPLTKNIWVLDGVRAAETYALWKVGPTSDKQHKKLTRILLGSLVVFEGAVVVHNINELRKQ